MSQLFAFALGFFVAIQFVAWSGVVPITITQLTQHISSKPNAVSP